MPDVALGARAGCSPLSSSANLRPRLFRQSAPPATRAPRSRWFGRKSGVRGVRSTVRWTVAAAGETDRSSRRPERRQSPCRARAVSTGFVGTHTLPRGLSGRAGLAFRPRLHHPCPRPAVCESAAAIPRRAPARPAASSSGDVSLHLRFARPVGVGGPGVRERWTPIFGQLVKVESRFDRRNLECHARDGATRLS